MRTIGLVGGTTWVSTMDYYRLFNEMVNEQLGGDNSAKVIINSVNFEEIRALSLLEDWKAVSRIICKAAESLEKAGAECILLGANTMHIVADDVIKKVKIPLIHIAEETAKEIKKQELQTVSLLGTRYTMSHNFFRDVLLKHGIEVIVPGEENAEIVNKVIYDELAKGIINEESRKVFISIVDSLAGHGADGVILGCTEIPLLLRPEDCPFPMFDTTRIHARAAVNFSLDIIEQKNPE